MPINVAYGPDAKLLGLAALLSGRGQKAARDEEIAIQLAERERDRKAALARQILSSYQIPGGGGRGRSQYPPRSFKEELELVKAAHPERAAPERREASGGFSRQQLLEQALIEQGLTPTQLLQQQRSARMGQDLESEQEYQTYLREKKLIDRAANLTDAEKLEAHRIHDLQYAGLEKPESALDEGPEFPEGQAIGQTWTDERGNTFTRDASGIPKVLVKGGGDQVDVDSLYQQAVNELGEDASPEDLEERMVSIYERNKRIRERLTGGGGGEGVTPQPSTKSKYGFAAAPATAAEAQTPDDLIALGSTEPAPEEVVAKQASQGPDLAAIEAGLDPKMKRRIAMITQELRLAKETGDHQGVMAAKKLLDELLTKAGVL